MGKKYLGERQEAEEREPAPWSYRPAAAPLVPELFLGDPGLCRERGCSEMGEPAGVQCCPSLVRGTKSRASMANTGKAKGLFSKLGCTHLILPFFLLILSNV